MARFARCGNRTLEAADRETTSPAVRPLVGEAGASDRTTGIAAGRTGSKANQRNSKGKRTRSVEHRGSTTRTASVARSLPVSSDGRRKLLILLDARVETGSQDWPSRKYQPLSLQSGSPYTSALNCSRSAANSLPCNPTSGRRSFVTMMVSAPLFTSRTRIRFGQPSKS